MEVPRSRQTNSQSPSQNPRKILPLKHPEYRYPESPNPYWKKVQSLPGLIYGDNQTESHRGEWRARFLDSAEFEKNHPGKRRELHVEIGCNAGHVILKWAQQNSDGAYIGIDWKFKQIFRGAEKASKAGLQNLIFFRAHADRITYMFGPEEVNRLYLYFPDPWPKKSQLKNRFVTPGNLTELSKIVRKGGIFHIKTDHAGYFQWMEEAISQVPHLWKVVDRSADLHATHPDPTQLEIPRVTLFEKIFIQRGIKIHSLHLERI